MTRVIKFRIWAKGAKKMHYDNFNITPDGKVGQTWGIYEHNLEIMQFTGLKDKNGKEIYEGDIVQEQTIMVGHMGKVYQQSSGEWMVSYRRGSHPLYIPDGYEDSRETHSLQDWTSDSRIAVIGNVFENSNLLK